MPTHIRNGRNASPRRNAEGSNAESDIATLWLVFYVIALGVAISSPLISRAIEFAALTRIADRPSACFTDEVFRYLHVFSSKSQYQGANLSLLILVVDDEPDVEILFRQQFRRDLRSGRFTMEFAQSADAALQCIDSANGVSIILILSDINMPGMTGLELLPKAKASRPNVPIIMITAYGDAETKRKALEGGAEALLTKPIDFGVLRGEIDSRVERAA